VPHIQNRLSDRNLRSLKPDPLRAYDLADGGDLYVRVETSGTVVFWLRYQLNGKRRRWAIGHYGTGKAGSSLTEARGKRDDAKKLHQELRRAPSRPSCLAFYFRLLDLVICSGGIEVREVPAQHLSGK